MVIWFVLALHCVAIVALIGVAAAGSAFNERIGRGVFAVATVPPVVSTGWALWWMAGSGGETTASFTWVDGLDIDIAFRVDALSALLALVVSGIGTAVFVYAGGYFSSTSKGLARFSATLLTFSTAMLGLVWADSVWTMFVFWELTSIASYLLIGFAHVNESTRLAARRASLITGAGGLILIAGLVSLTDVSGSTSLRDLDPATGTAASAAAVLVLLAAATKSAQVPFHMWLPGAMSAPTPVSAYLHSATMVKIGVIAIAIFQPALGDTAPWTPLGVALGGTSMLWGAVGALRHVDAKLILAWGTISQLGLMIVLLSVGTPKATFAALSILAAHAIFKAALFMVVGEIDVRTGTRDIQRLRGLRSAMPTAFLVAVASGASMAGVPPLLGFAAKEAAIEAGLGLSGVERVVVLAVVIGGSVLTVAYTIRFLIGVFGDATVGDDAIGEPAAPRRPMSVVTSFLGIGSVAGFVLLGVVSDTVQDAAVIIDPGSAVYQLIRWPGLKTAFVISMAIVFAGAVLGVALARRSMAVPRPVAADTVDGLVDAALRGARTITSIVQHGSLPRYMTVFALVTAAAAVPFVVAFDTDALIVAENGVQAALVVLILAGAVGVVFVRARLGAALSLGAVGFGVAGLFVVHGAPDLALTQLLVETVIVVGFVIGLGSLSRDFPTAGVVWQRVRIVLSCVVGLGVMVALAASASNPTGSPPIADLNEQAVDVGGGNNVVNVILTDIRALDTLGEVVVLVVVAIGVMSLARARRADPDALTGLGGDAGPDGDTQHGDTQHGDTERGAAAVQSADHATDQSAEVSS